MHQIQSFGADDPVYDGHAYTISTTYHTGTGTLQMYTTHPTQALDASSSQNLVYGKTRYCRLTSLVANIGDLNNRRSYKTFTLQYEKKNSTSDHQASTSNYHCWSKTSGDDHNQSVREQRFHQSECTTRFSTDRDAASTELDGPAS